jgi:hypothetical protein
MHIPNFVAFSVHGKNATVHNYGHTIPTPDKVELLLRVNFWVYGVAIKVISCVAVTVLSLRLKRTLMEIERRRQVLITAPGRGRIESTRSSIVMMKEWQSIRTTRIMLAILIFFLITEIPQGILSLLSGFFGCYHSFGDMIEMLELLNSPVIFILYCSTSRQFRKNIMALFRPPVLDRPLPDPQQNGNNGCTICSNMNRITRF